VLCDVVWHILSSNYRQLKLIASAMPGCRPGLLVGFPCYAPQSLGYWYEKYVVGICPPGLLRLLPMERVWALLWKDAPVPRGCLYQYNGNSLSSHARKSKGGGSGHCKGVGAESAPPAKRGLTGFGRAKCSLT